MINKLKKMLCIVAVVAIAVSIGPLSVIQSYAASTVSIDAPSTVEAGETFTVTVKFDGDDIGRVDGEMTYDSSVISYLSGGSSSGDSGYIQLSDGGTGEAIQFNLKFKAVEGGTSSLEVSTNGVYNLEEEFIDSPSASSSVTVEGEEETTQTTVEETTVTETETTEITEPEDIEDTGFLSKPLLMLFALAACVIIVILIFAIAVSKSSKKGRHSKRR